MSDLIPSNQSVSGSLVVKNMEDLSRLSTMLANSGFFTDAKGAAQCGVKVLAGLELGVPAFSAMVGIHIINGKPSLSANLMAAIVKRSGKYNYRVKRHSPQECQIEFFENGESVGVSGFTLEEARKAGTKNLDKFARNMLFARAMSNGVRWYCPDIFIGAVYTPEELGASTNEEGEVIEVFEESQPEVQTKLKPVSLTENNQRVLTARQLLGISKETLREHLDSDYGVKNPVHLTVDQVDELIEWMAIEWAVSLGWDVEEVTEIWTNERELVIDAGWEDETQLKAWMMKIHNLAEEDKAAFELYAGLPASERSDLEPEHSAMKSVEKAVFDHPATEKVVTEEAMKAFNDHIRL
jgi:hypothetical protein